MKIGEMLIKKGLLTQQQLTMALDESRRTGQIIGQTLVNMNLVSKSKLLETLAEQLGLVFYDSLRNINISPETIKAVPAKYVWHYKFMPVALKENTLTIAVYDPLAIWQTEDLKLHLGFDVERVLATEEEILSALRKYYGVGSETIEDIISQDTTVVEKKKEEKIQEAELIEKSAEDASVIKLVSQILEEAVSSRATDIHIEAFRDEVRVRYRIDGVLYRMRFPEEIRYLHQAIVSRIKIISNLNVVERRLPQDGRSIIKIHDK